MKFILSLYLLALIPGFLYADAGFNIRRPKAPCYAVFKGIDKLPEFEFFKNIENDKGKDKGRFTDSAHQLHNNDSLTIYYTEGKRYWEGPIKILIRNKVTQQFVDSFTLVAEGYNLTINFTKAENNTVKYTIEKSKAEYPYRLFSDEDISNTSLAKRNKFILISLSAIGFLILAFMFYKRKRTNIS